MKNGIFWLTILTVFLSACSNRDNSGFIPAQPSVVPEATAPIEIWEQTDLISSQNFIESETEECKYVFLQSNDSKSIIGCIDQIFVSDSVVVVVDNSITDKIVLFDKNGKYIQSIGSKGKARGEYLGLGCASETSDGNIGVTDRLSSKLIVYSPKGEVIDEYKMNKLMPHSMILSDSLILGSYPGYINSSKYRVTWVDYDGNEINSAFPFTSTRRYVAGKLLKDRGGKVYYNYPLNDTIFRIKDDKIIPEIVMNIHDSEMTNEFIKSTEDLDDKDYIDKLIGNDDIVNLVELIKCDNKWLAYYQKGTNSYISVVSEKGKQRTTYKKSIVSHSNKTGKLLLPEKFVGYDDCNLIGYIDTEAFSFMESSDKAEYLKRIKDNSINAPENDDEITNYGNLILCVYKLK